MHSTELLVSLVEVVDFAETVSPAGTSVMWTDFSDGHSNEDYSMS